MLDRQLLFDTLTVGLAERHSRADVIRWLGRFVLAMIVFGVFPWRVSGQMVRPSGRITLLRLHELRSRAALPGGSPRPAGAGDRPLLRGWFRLFQERFPADPSHVEFVVDHPLEAGAIIVWEVDDRPVAMSSRTPEVAGMVRMGLAFQPTGGSTYADAASCGDASISATRPNSGIPGGVTFVHVPPPSRVTCTSPSSDPVQITFTSVRPGATAKIVA